MAAVLPQKRVRRRRRRLKEPMAMSQAMESVLGTLGLRGEVEWLRILGVWERAVGAKVAKQAQPHSLRGKTLLVGVASAAWRNELTFLKQELLDKLNAELRDSRIAEIKLIAGRPPSGGDAGSSAGGGDPIVEPTLEACRRAQAAAADIGDDELRRAFERAMALDLTRRR